MSHKIGIYVRVSTEEQAQVTEGSIESQQYRVKSFVDLKNLQENNWGKIIDTYIDDGFSAKNTKRPAYQRMLQDVHRGRIGLILVTDISRLSRNISDFCILLKDLEQNKAKFLSIKEQFDTSTPAGEMMIFNMINLAQFERKQTSERISMNFHARAMRGLNNGGTPILGLDKDPANPGKLIANEDEAKVVRFIFETYLEVESISKTAKIANEQGMRRKPSSNRADKHVQAHCWTHNTVFRLLHNYAYIGKREVNKTNKNQDQQSLKSWQRYEIVNATWPAIVPEKIFYQVQRILQESLLLERQKHNKASFRTFYLSGRLFCDYCKRSLIGESHTGKYHLYRYYGHKTTIGDPTTCPVKRYPASPLEDKVISYLEEIIEEAGYLEQIEDTIRSNAGLKKTILTSNREQILNSLEKVKKELDSLLQFSMSLGMDSSGIYVVKEKLETLAEKRRTLEQTMEGLRQKEHESEDLKKSKAHIQTNLEMFRKGWKQGKSNVKKRLLRNILQKVYLSDEGLKIFFWLDEEKNTPRRPKKGNNTSGTLEGVPLLSSECQVDGKLVDFSSIYSNGGGDRNPKYSSILQSAKDHFCNKLQIIFAIYFEKKRALRDQARLSKSVSKIRTLPIYNARN